MRRLIKQRDIVVDEWRYADEDPVGRERALILPFARWKEERDRWWLWDGRLGVRLGPTDPVGVEAQGQRTSTWTTTLSRSCDSISTIDGSVVHCLARFITSSVKVAENSSVWRSFFGGVWRMI